MIYHKIPVRPTRLSRKTGTLGFTLLELMITTALLVIISTLTLVASKSATNSMALSRAKEQSMNDLRATMQAISSEVEQATKTTDATQGITQLTVTNSGRNLTFQVRNPATASGVWSWSTPITYAYINEDTGAGAHANNARLDSDEINTSTGAGAGGVLKRRIVRTQDGNSQVLAAANNLSSVNFALNAAGNVLTVTLQASRGVNTTAKRRDVIREDATAQIFLMN